MKVGDLVKIVKYGCRFAPDGSVGIITKKLPLYGPSSHFHQAFEVQFQNGYLGRHADFALEVLSESR